MRPPLIEVRMRGSGAPNVGIGGSEGGDRLRGAWAPGPPGEGRGGSRPGAPALPEPIPVFGAPDPRVLTSISGDPSILKTPPPHPRISGPDPRTKDARIFIPACEGCDKNGFQEGTGAFVKLEEIVWVFGDWCGLTRCANLKVGKRFTDY